MTLERIGQGQACDEVSCGRSGGRQAEVDSNQTSLRVRNLWPERRSGHRLRALNRIGGGAEGGRAEGGRAVGGASEWVQVGQIGGHMAGSA